MIVDALKRNYKEPIGKIKIYKFNNFEQRQYDFEDLEKNYWVGENRKNKLILDNS
ncbi:hypothetical protein [Clostridium botulinum]|uniref:hypothetical protein n=1 Tax=Clostridium botulinum TaxID=1491 RepID=UPI00131B7EE5|nr:hypothetical protein [Clostridium botulinum]